MHLVGRRRMALTTVKPSPGFLATGGFQVPMHEPQLELCGRPLQRAGVGKVGDGQVTA
jgi:hypothetical protein